jgi:hypothetical protein
MKLARFAALAALVGMLSSLAPAPVAADGAASTRNILIGTAAATLIILNHNAKVHEKYAEKDRQIAAEAQARNDAIAAYNAEKSAYEHEAAVAGSLKRQLAYKDSQIAHLKHELATNGIQGKNYVASTVTKVPTPNGEPQKVAVVSFGWGAF